MNLHIRFKLYYELMKGTVIGRFCAVIKLDLGILSTVLTIVVNFAPMGSVLLTIALLPEPLPQRRWIQRMELGSGVQC